MDPRSIIDAFAFRERLPAEFRDAAIEVYEPLAARLAMQLRDSSLVVGLCGAQGSGKSTVAGLLKLLVEAHGLSVAVVSIDDFYLTQAERESLAGRVHPLLATRGVPGTHDMALAISVLNSLRTAGKTLIPRFDKAVDDRRDRDSWEVFSGPARLVILEGWYVGARSQAARELLSPINDLERDSDADGVWRRYVNDALAGEYQQLFAMLDYLILLAAPDFAVVERWRSEQEHRLQTKIAAGSHDVSRLLNDAQIRRFIAHFERLTRHILAEMPSRADELITLDENRRPVHVTFNTIMPAAQ